jgi:chromosome segregation ATPase
MDRKAFVDKLTAQLKKWDNDLDKLEAKAQKAKADARADYDKQIQGLRNKKKAAQERLEEVKHAGEDAWEDLKAGAQEAYDSIKEAFQSGMSKFK